MNLRNHLVSAYCENPCQVLPNALWKTLAQLENMRLSARVHNGAVFELKVSNDTVMMTYWTRTREPSHDCFLEHDTLDVALVHQDYLHAFPSQRFSVRRPYFRLIHRQDGASNKPLVPPDFSIVAANPQQEYEQIANFIGHCYQDIHPAASTVLGWSKHPTFDPALWIWLFDDAKGVPAGLGIAEVDTEISESSLEWIQTLPNYRGIGLGKVIVQELLSRIRERARFTTVAGEIENRSNPEALYRSCGFEGDDIWWMFGKT
jgi:GNAT superfamily N-acetyltransferase